MPQSSTNLSVSASKKTPSVAAIIQRWHKQPGPLLPILLEVHQHYQALSEQHLQAIAEALNLSKAEVHGVYSFYEDFHRRKGKPIHLQVCTAEACQSLGCRQLVEDLQQRLQQSINQPKSDSPIAFESVYCLGNCAVGPSVRLGDLVIGRAQAEQIQALVQQAFE